LRRVNRLPQKFTESLRGKLGAEIASFAESLELPPPVSIRSNPAKAPPSLLSDAVGWCQYGRYLPIRPVFTLDPLFHGGAYYVQEASSMFLEQAFQQTVDPGQPLNVLDLCAAPGGKSTHILSLINRESLLVSNDVIRSRASILSENIQKWGYPNAIVSNNDPADFGKLTGFFDVMVVDAPCSGEGLFRKEPEAIEEWSPENVQLCASRQKRIIADVWDALRENGIFVYCTCTYNRDENEENLKWLQNNHAVEFVRLKIDPAWGVEEVKEGKMTGYRFFPHRAKGEGFFLAIIRKLAAVQSLRIKPKRAIAEPLKKVRERLNEWIIDSKSATFFQFNDLVFYAPSSKTREVEFLTQFLKVMYAGTNLASVKHEKLIPDHALALSVDLNQGAFPVVALNLDDALKYLRRENIQLTGTPPGFTLLTYEKLPIGWVNVLSNRVNNMYPSEWRIRMK
jgi:16S rRNA C967 or C1407 C5-methylase (RsmB/RsmF family)/NOL1/NOP2/fmu family ribosome biogenesis protein